jgi:serine/threonine-protein kinase
VLTALSKLPADRFPTAADFARALENPGYAGTTTIAAGRSAAPSLRRPVLALAALALVASALAAWGWLRSPAQAAGDARRLDLIAFPDSLAPVAGFATPTMSLAPDGRTLVYMTDEPAGRLAVRDPDRLRPRLLAGTENAKWPQVSPDGRNVLFTRGPYLVGSLEVIPIAGGAPRVLVPDSVFVGASWGPDGSVYYQRGGRLLRRGPDGGAPEVISEPDGPGGWFRPLAVAGGLLVSRVTSPSDVRPVIQALPRDGGEPRPLTEGIALAYLEPGLLVVLSNAGADRAFVAPFDPRTLALTGELAPLAPAFPSADVGWADIAVSRTTLYYRQRTGAPSTLVWVDRSGRARPVDPGWEVAGIGTPALSPDGRRVAVAVDDRIVVKQLDQGPAIHVVPAGSGARALRPAWHPDGRAIAYFAYSTSDSVRVVRDDGVGAPAPLVEDPRGASDAAWSPDGRWIIYRTPVESGTGADIMMAPADGSAPPRPLVATPAQETTPTPSPDGRWLAYTSYESGRPEVYVRPFPNVGDGRWQVSARGGGQPRWAAGSGEIFYVSADGMLNAARLASGPAFEVTSRTELFPVAPYQMSAGFHHDYDVTRDGQRFIMVQLGAPGQFVREEHWLAAHPELPQ